MKRKNDDMNWRDILFDAVLILLALAVAVAVAGMLHGFFSAQYG